MSKKAVIIAIIIIILIIGTVIFFILNNKEEENRMQETNNQNHAQQTENSINGQGQDMAQVPVFDFETRTVTLNSGYEMPLNGIGTYSLTGDECYNSIISALNTGVRLIDTAYMYHNEEEIGRAIRDSGVPREEIFVITKIYPSQFNDPEGAIEMALKKLDIGCTIYSKQRNSNARLVSFWR